MAHATPHDGADHPQLERETGHSRSRKTVRGDCNSPGDESGAGVRQLSSWTESHFCLGWYRCDCDDLPAAVIARKRCPSCSSPRNCKRTNRYSGLLETARKCGNSFAHARPGIWKVSNG